MALTDLLLGRPLATDEESEQRVGVLAGIPMLGLDALVPRPTDRRPCSRC